VEVAQPIAHATYFICANAQCCITQCCSCACEPLAYCMPHARFSRVPAFSSLVNRTTSNIGARHICDYTSDTSCAKCMCAAESVRPKHLQHPVIRPAENTLTQRRAHTHTLIASNSGANQVCHTCAVIQHIITTAATNGWEPPGPTHGACKGHPKQISHTRVISIIPSQASNHTTRVAACGCCC